MLGILMKLAEQITGIDITDWINDWNSNPVIANLNTLVGDSLATIFRVQTNIQSLLGALDFLDPSFDPEVAIESFIQLMLLPTNLIPGLISGVLSATVIPGLDASKIISGIFGTGLIPGLDVSKIISGVFGSGFIPSLDASKIISGVFGTGQIPGLDVSKIISGVFGSGFIPTLDASKIISGVFGVSQIPILPRINLSTMDFSNLLPDGGFENGGTGFSGSAGVVTITDPPVSGTKAYQVTTAGAINDKVFDSIPVAPGEVWYVEAMIRKTTTGTTGNASLGVTFSLDYTSLEYAGTNVALSGMAQNIWQKTGLQVTVPAGKNRLEVRPSIRETIPAGQVIQFDDVKARKVATNELISGLIDFAKLGGYGGPLDMGATAQATWDQLISGFVNTVGTGSALSDLYNIANEIGSWAGLGRDSWDKLGFRSNKALDRGLLPSGTGTAPLVQVGSGASATTVGVTSTSSLLAWKIMEEDLSIGVVSWLGSGNANITDMRLNIWSIDASSVTGVLHRSANIVGNIASSMQFNIYTLPTKLETKAGDVVGFELVMPGGTGTHSVATTTTWLPDHPVAVPKKLAAKRTGTGNMDNNPPPTTDQLVPFTDFFSSEDTTKWNSANLAQSQVTINSGRLQIAPTANTSNSPEVNSIVGFGFNGKQMIVEVPQVANEQTVFFVNAPGSNAVGFKAQAGGLLTMTEYVNGVTNATTVTYNATNHRWWRIRHDGTNLCWDTSPDGLTWYFARSKAPPSSTTYSSDCWQKLGVWAGAVASPGVALFDNFNLPRSTAFTYINDVAFFETAVETGFGTPYHSPEKREFTSNQTYPIPSWCNHVDVLVLGGGGGGKDGNSWYWTEGGYAGSWGQATWDRGTHFTSGDSVVITIGAGGLSNQGANGSPGGNSTAVRGAYTVTGNGGAGGSAAGTSVDPYGDSPGNITRNGITYSGGAQQTALNTAGNAPGGGGSAGNSELQTGGPGAAGRVWLYFYQ